MIYASDSSLSQLQSNESGETYRNFAKGFVYNAAGAVTSMKLGNGRWENTTFNSRMQPTKIGLGAVVASQSLLKLEYSYGTTANNGNVQSQTIIVPEMAYTLNQAYTYDELNRLLNAEETYNATPTWEQTFTYDRYGNRNFDEANTTTLPKNCGSSPNYTVCSTDVPKVNPAVTASTNKFTTGYAYDSSGNTTEDANEWTYIYDADNKQIEVKDDQEVTVGNYYYDGDGKRIKKYVPDTGEATIFIYDAAGKLIQEHSTIVQTGGNANIVYTTSDSLGSPRINTNGIGQIVARHDYRPFGEEVATAQRTSGLGYTTDMLRKQFTGYERDNESGLDYAINRYHSAQLGRFSSADPYNIIFEKEKAKSAEEITRILDKYLADAQNWNKYAYVVNNPLKYSDPDGRRPQTDQEKRDLDFLRNLANNSHDADLKRAVLDAVKGIEDAIAVSKDKASDPRGLRIALWAANRAAESDTSRFGLQGTARLNSNHQTVAIGPTTDPSNPQWKCNLFVVSAHVLGGNVPLGGDGVPTATSLTKNGGNRGPDVIVNIPSANTWASTEPNAVVNYELMGSPQQGDVVAWKLNGPYGHTAISIGGSAVIYASDKGVKVQTIQYVSSQYGAAVYRRKKE